MSSLVCSSAQKPAAPPVEDGGNAEEPGALQSLLLVLACPWPSGHSGVQGGTQGELKRKKWVWRVEVPMPLLSWHRSYLLPVGTPRTLHVLSVLWLVTGDRLSGRGWASEVGTLHFTEMQEARLLPGVLLFTLFRLPGDEPDLEGKCRSLVP